MLHLYQSNRLEALSTLLHEWALAEPPASPYARETIIVQARGMGRWLSLKIAARFGVCANVDFPLPATFLWHLAETVLGPQSRQGPFGADALAWRLRGLLANPPAALADYLAGDGSLTPQTDNTADSDTALSARRRWRLASRIADVFDQYLVYRPDWLARWENGERCGLGDDEGWQMQLWQALTAGRQTQHRADLMQRLVDRLNDPAPLDLPERIVLFGISSLPPTLHAVIKALATRSEVMLFALNPCAAPWGDITRQIDSTSPGERLLAAWGAQGRVFFDDLAADDQLHSLFDEAAPHEGHVLAQLQLAILTLEAHPTRPIAPDDNSLAIHACHGPMRQVETLKDALLSRFAADPTLQPADVVVLVPGMDDYAPYIDAVFGQSERSGAGTPSVPYAIADRSSLAASPLLAGFIKLLHLPDGNWEADQLAGLLELPALAARFGLAEVESGQLRRWLAEAGVRRGQAGDAFSWQAGIGRLLLGVAMPSGAESHATGLPLFAGLYPESGLDLRFAEAIAGLARFARQLAEWQADLATARGLPDWSVLLISWLGRWFDDNEADASTLADLRKTLSSLHETAQHSSLQTAVDRVSVTEWLTASLEKGSGAGGFLTGGVTFAQLMPMRNLPFRVVAVLGLDDGVFPRESQPDGFDLVAQYPRRGDRARALDERWLFLETLLAARDSLLLFYTGRDARTDKELPPSTVIADLLDALAGGWVSAEGELPVAQLLHQHPLQPFSPARFKPQMPSFDQRWAGIAAIAGRGQARQTALTAAALPHTAPALIELADLLRFARDPSSWFLRRLGVQFDRGSEEIPTRELFALSSGDERSLLQLAGDQADDATVLAQLGQGAALLPTGQTGLLWATSTAAHFAPAVQAWRQLGQAGLPVRIKQDDWQLQGVLSGLDETGLGLRANGKLREGDRIAAWLQTLVLSVAEQTSFAPAGRLLGLDEQAQYRAPQYPADVLADWISLYREAHSLPSALLPRSSLAYASALQKGKTPEQALLAAQLAWQGNWQQTGESAYASHRAIWRGQTPFDDERFAAVAEQLLIPLLEHETITEYAA